MLSGGTVDPTFFTTPAELRKWLEQHHDSAKELFVGFYKKATGKPSLTYQEALDEALCFGWIDGIVRSLGAESYMQRFTPRRPRSTWSQINIRRVEQLKHEGRMHP